MAKSLAALGFCCAKSILRRLIWLRSEDFCYLLIRRKLATMRLRQTFPDGCSGFFIELFRGSGAGCKNSQKFGGGILLGVGQLPDLLERFLKQSGHICSSN